MTFSIPLCFRNFNPLVTTESKQRIIFVEWGRVRGGIFLISQISGTFVHCLRDRDTPRAQTVNQKCQVERIKLLENNRGEQ